jgi:hypothetical protein
MRIPVLFGIRLWSAVICVAVAAVSYVLDQSHDITVVTLVVAALVLAIDWLTMPKKKK